MTTRPTSQMIWFIVSLLEKAASSKHTSSHRLQNRGSYCRSSHEHADWRRISLSSLASTARRTTARAPVGKCAWAREGECSNFPQGGGGGLSRQQRPWCSEEDIQRTDLATDSTSRPCALCPVRGRCCTSGHCRDDPRCRPAGRGRARPMGAHREMTFSHSQALRRRSAGGGRPHGPRGCTLNSRMKQAVVASSDRGRPANAQRLVESSPESRPLLSLLIECRPRCARAIATAASARQRSRRAHRRPRRRTV